MPFCLTLHKKIEQYIAVTLLNVTYTSKLLYFYYN